jgi:hypothetical protein
MTRAIARRLRIVAVLAFGEVYLASCTDGEINLLPGRGAGELTDAGGGGAASTSSGATSTSAGGDAGAHACDPTCGCGLGPCGASCFDLENDPSHCGRCDQACNHNAYCHQGKCTCLPGFTDCDGACVFTAADPDRCGGCAFVCSPGENCQDSQCGPAACTGGLTACASENNRHWCVDLGSSEPFCGSCGVICAPTEVCAGGSCRLYAPAAPCASCPCPSCDALVGAPSLCCPGVAGGAAPICVHGMACP